MRVVSNPVAVSIEENQSIVYNGKIRFYKSRVYFKEADIVDNSETWMDTLIEDSVLPPEAIYYNVEKTTLFSAVVNADGDILFYVDNTGVPRTCSLTSSVYSRLGLWKDKLYYFTGSQWNVATLDLDNIISGSGNPIISDTLYVNLNAEGAIYPVSDDECMLVYVDEGFVRPAYIGTNGELQIAPSRFINPISLIDPIVVEDMEIVRMGGAAKLGDNVYLYQTMANGEADVIYCTTSALTETITWSDITIAIPKDLSIFNIGNVFLYGERIYICGSLRRTDEFASGSIFTLLCWSIDGLTFSLDRRTLVTTSIHRFQCAVMDTQVCFTTLQKSHTESTPYFISLENTEYSEYEQLNVNCSGANTFITNLAAGDEAPFDDPILDTGTMATLWLGTMDASGQIEYIIYNELVLAEIIKTLSDGKKSFSASLVTDGIWHTQFLTHPFYMEFLGRDVLVDDVSALQNLYKLDAKTGADCSLECDLWTVSGQNTINAPRTLAASGVLDAYSPDFETIASRYPEFGADATYEIKVYGWSRTGDDAPDTSDNGEIYITLIVQDENKVRSTIVTTALELTSDYSHFPQTWHTSAVRAGSLPIVYEIANPGQGWEIIQIGVHVVAPSTGSIQFYISRIEMPAIIMAGLTASATGSVGWGGGLMGTLPGPGNKLTAGTWGPPYNWSRLSETMIEEPWGEWDGVECSAQFGTKKYFGGWFTNIGTIEGACSIVCFDTSTGEWSKMGSKGLTWDGDVEDPGYVYGIDIDSDGNVYAVGLWNMADDVSCAGIAKYLIATNEWITMDFPYLDPDGWDVEIHCVLVHPISGDIYVGGGFPGPTGDGGLSYPGSYCDSDNLARYNVTTNEWESVVDTSLQWYAGYLFYMCMTCDPATGNIFFGGYRTALNTNVQSSITFSWYNFDTEEYWTAPGAPNWDWYPTTAMPFYMTWNSVDHKVYMSTYRDYDTVSGSYIYTFDPETSIFTQLAKLDNFIREIPVFCKGGVLYTTVATANRGTCKLIKYENGTWTIVSDEIISDDVYTILVDEDTPTIYVGGWYYTIDGTSIPTVAKLMGTFTPGMPIITFPEFNFSMGSYIEEPLPIQSISTSKKGIAEMLFATIPYQAKNFSVMTSWTIVGSYSTVGCLGFAVDNDNFLLGYVRKDHIGLLLRRNGLETLISEIDYTFDPEAEPFDIRFTHIDGLFTIDVKAASVAEWSVKGTPFSYEWKTADGPISSSDIIFHVGIYSIIDPPRFRTTGFLVNRGLIPVMPNPVNPDGVNEFLDVFPASGQIDCEDVIYTYDGKITNMTTIEGPYQVRLFDDYSGTKALDFTDFIWQSGHENDLSGLLLATNDGETVFISTANWQPMLNNEYKKNAVRVYSNDWNTYNGGYNQKLYITNALTNVVPVPLVDEDHMAAVNSHPEGAFVFLDSNDKITLHYFMAANSDPDQTVKNLIDKVTKIAGTKAVFPGDIITLNLSLTDGEEGTVIS